MFKYFVCLIVVMFGLACEPETKTKYVEVEVPVFPEPPEPPPPLPPPQSGFLGFAWFEDAMLNYAQSVSTQDAENLFFLVGCDQKNISEEMANFKKGVDKGINSLSTERTLVKTAGVGGTGCIWAFDQRDVDIANAELELVTDRALFTVISETVRGETLQFLLQKQVTWSFADDFFLTAFEGDTLTDFAGDTYRTIVDQALLDVDFEAAEGVDTFQDFEDEEAYAGSITNSPIAFNSRFFWHIEGDNGWMHRAHDASLRQPDSTLTNPFNVEMQALLFTDKIFAFVAKETLYKLLNGMLGVRLSDAAGNGLSAAPADVVTDVVGGQNGLEPVIRLASCFSCHNSGLQGYVDELGPHIARTSSFNNDEKLLGLVFFNDANNQQAFEESDAAYARALGQLDIVPDDPDPISRMITPVRQPYGVSKGSAKFFLTPGEYQECLDGADVAQANLGAHLEGRSVTLQVMADNFQNVIDECNLFRDIEL